MVAAAKERTINLVSLKGEIPTFFKCPIDTILLEKPNDTRSRWDAAYLEDHRSILLSFDQPFPLFKFLIDKHPGLMLYICALQSGGWDQGTDNAKWALLSQVIDRVACLHIELDSSLENEAFKWFVRQPASILRHCTIVVKHGDLPNKLSQPSDGLFKGDAPLLRELRLLNYGVPAEHANFPSLVALDIRSAVSSFNVTPLHTTFVAWCSALQSLHSLQLHQLSIDLHPDYTPPCITLPHLQDISVSGDPLSTATLILLFCSGKRPRTVRARFIANPAKPMNHTTFQSMARAVTDVVPSIDPSVRMLVDWQERRNTSFTFKFDEGRTFQFDFFFTGSDVAHLHGRKGFWSYVTGYWHSTESGCPFITLWDMVAKGCGTFLPSIQTLELFITPGDIPGSAWATASAPIPTSLRGLLERLDGVETLEILNMWTTLPYFLSDLRSYNSNQLPLLPRLARVGLALPVANAQVGETLSSYARWRSTAVRCPLVCVYIIASDLSQEAQGQENLRVVATELWAIISTCPFFIRYPDGSYLEYR
jgi:hypothetical protein